jgi:cytochrome c oxidase cbb3-type subunit 4
MDITTLRVIATLMSFVAFIGIIIWALDKRKTAEFNEAAKLPFLDE